VVRADAAAVVERPPRAVFDFVATEFFRNYPRWAPEVRELVALSPGPLRIGSLGRQVRVDYGRRTEATFRVTRLEPCMAVAFEGLTSPFTIDYAFQPWGAHTRVTLVFQLLRLELFMRPFERAIRGVARDSVADTMRRLKALAERELAAEPPATAVPPAPADSPPVPGEPRPAPAESPPQDPAPGLNRA
jgi:hypothetical protein